MSGIRILGGSAAGRSLRVPASARPSGGRLREALFSIWMKELEGAHFLDLFAGSGAVGLEALSRGARDVVFVETDRRALATIRSNLSLLGWEESGAIIREDLPRWGSWASGPCFDLIFADPPYDFLRWDDLLAGAGEALAVDGEIACEHRRPWTPIPGWIEVRRSRHYGDSRLTFLGRDREA